MEITVNGYLFEVLVSGEIYRKESKEQDPCEWVFTGLYAFNYEEALGKIISFLN